MTHTLKLSTRCRLQLPAAVAERAGLVSGDTLLVYVHDGEVRLRRIEPVQHSDIEQVAGCLAASRRHGASDSS